VFSVCAALVAGPGLDQGRAVENDYPVRTPAAQVRILENGRFVGGGTLVDRNWVLTTAHLFGPLDTGAYSLRFGVIDDQNDQNTPASRRLIDGIVRAPAGDVAMVHFADPVPAETWIPRLATGAPEPLDWARLYGWGGPADGHSLHRASTLVYDPMP
jgi:hypothetical protein